MRENSEQITSKLLHQGLWQSAVLLIRNGTQEVDARSKAGTSVPIYISKTQFA